MPLFLDQIILCRGIGQPTEILAPQLNFGGLGANASMLG